MHRHIISLPADSRAWAGESLASRILTFRRQAQLSQQALAAFLGVGQRTVSRWERGVDHPSPGLLQRLDALIGTQAAPHLPALPALYDAIRDAPVPLALVDGAGNVLVASRSHPAHHGMQARPADRLPQVLVVEDDHGVLQATKAILNRWEFRCFGITSGDGAVEAVRSGDVTPDAAIIDYLLPGSRDGVDTARALLALIPDLPILIVTGEAIVENIRKIADSGLSVITKPVDPKQFHLALKALLLMRGTP